MENTPNYGLKKPAQAGDYDIQDHNDNSDIIDAALKANADQATGSKIYAYKNLGGAL